MRFRPVTYGIFVAMCGIGLATLGVVLDMPGCSTAHASETISEVSDPFPGRHMFEGRWLNDDSGIKARLERVPWSQKCELRRSKNEIGFSVEGTINADGKLTDPKIMLFGVLLDPEDPELESCLTGLVQDITFSVSAGFTPGHEGEGWFRYQYFLP